MKNTKTLYQQVLDKANQVRIEQYEKISDMINQLTAISIIAHSLINTLKQDPAYKYGLDPYEDLGPVEEAETSFQDDEADDIDPAAEDVPAYTPKPGCASCVYKDFCQAE